MVEQKLRPTDGRFVAFDVDLLLTFCVSDCHEVSLIDVSEVFDRRSVSFHCSNLSSPDPLP